MTDNNNVEPVQTQAAQKPVSSYARKYRSLIPCPHPNVVFVL